MLVNNGQTLVLGGIFQEDRNNAQTKTPLLAKIPILGRLFRRTVRREDKQELLIFITPNILDAATASTGAPSAGAFAPLMGASAQSGANLLP